MYQRIYTVNFRDELSKASITSYLHPVIKQQGEAYGLIAMVSTQITELSILTTYLWPDYETAQAARDEYGHKIVEALRKAGAKVETKEGPVERAWFNGIDVYESAVELLTVKKRPPEGDPYQRRCVRVTCDWQC